MTPFQNDKARLFRILSGADAVEVRALAAPLQAGHEVTAVKEPCKTLAMIQLREPVASSLYDLGEVLVCEAAVTLDGAPGMAVTLGSDPDKALHMAIIDAAFNRGVFTDTETLLRLEREQADRLARENALHRQTAVDFSVMDTEAPQ